MMKNKMIATSITIILGIVLVGAIAIIIINKMDTKKETTEPSIEEVVENSLDVPEITTNLKDNHFIKIALKIETNNKKAKEELEKRDFQVKDSVIEELSEVTSNDLKGRKGKEKLTNTLKTKIDHYLQNGNVVKIYITSYVIQ
ncbi:flagellar basal body-associated protein FliL [Heyndrickxia sporothermodurans]|nr:flagellar basal body-associated protein FliL [Heyndrickxia sporothermodurans]MEB6548203.1 flagellar basal body-associated protein FliL [Heyndrickxia sporothermodurans]MED3649902.1 flagellar basal body-associated protein FliL [Heyndrickxia sporothermodurans]MED3653358.1 flagellar basal body-associated protein FliL [Heyndrickxia sporothermodurans]MED3697888.1 flagellar basal body-associated protein FliL [Heyndrickxia sporothermodurans]MED3781261.1 flagellar basal body-associated protein FliL 